MLRLAKIQAPAVAADYISIDFTNPMTTTHSTVGETKDTKLFLYNDDATKTYKAISLTASDTVATSEAGWFTFAADSSGSPGAFSSSLNFADGDYRTGVAFWVRVAVPSGQAVQNKSDIKIALTRSEYAV